MTASRLDDLSVNDFDDAADVGDLTTDIRSGNMPDAQLLSLNPVGDAELMVYTHDRLARGTEPGMANAVAHAIEHGHAEVLREDGSVRMVISIPPAEPDPHVDCAVSLHEALTALLALESVITRNGGHLWPQDQESLFAARRLLERHGRR
jgi:hypothetical protein